MTFSSGETEKTFTVTATEDNLEDGGEGMKLSFVNLPPEATLGTTNEATVTIINKAAQNSLTVAFQSVAYSVPEGNSVVVTVILSAAPGSEVTVPLTVTEQGGATSADYSGVPASVTFGPDERDQTFTVSATQDVVDDDEESVVIGFGTLSDGVREGGVGNTTVDIRDDDDPAVVVSFGSATYTVAEGGTVEVTVTLSADPERTVIIPMTKVNQGTASDADYSGVPSGVTFQSGETSKSFDFSATQDTIDDDGESVRLGSGSMPDARVSAGTPDETTVNLTDDDVPSVAVSFGSAAYTVTEGGTVEVTVTLSADPERTVIIPLTVTNQDGATTGDYSVPNSITVLAGQTSQTIIFTATDDTEDDDDESVLMAFGTLPDRVTPGSINQATVMITDNDDPRVVVSFGQPTHTVAEGDSITMTVTLDTEPERTVVIPLTAMNQGGASQADYFVPNSVTFAPDQTSQTFTFTALDDEEDDDDESVLITFGTSLPDRVNAGTANQARVNIRDDDDPKVTVSFGEPTYTVPEGGTQAVTVTLSADPERTVEIPIMATNQGSASSADYTVPSSVAFNSREMSKTITFTAADDSIDDDDESVLLAFGTLPAGVSEGSPSETTVSITDDDDPAVTVSFGASTYTAAEGGTATVTVTLSADPERTVEVRITATNQGGASAADYSGVPTSVTFDAGDTSKTFDFAATQDAVDDDGESVEAGVRLPAGPGISGGSPSETVVSITDDDVPSTVVVSFGSAAYTVTEGGTVEVTVTLSADPERTVTIPMTKTEQGATSDADYSGVPSSVTFNAGEMSKSFDFVATQDLVDDDGESVKLTLGNLPDGVAAGSTNEAIVSITDDDVPTETTVVITDDDDAPAGKVTLELTPATINESGTGNASMVTASIPSASSAATTVTVSVNPADTTTLTGNTTLTIPAGETDSTGVVTITAVNDDAYTGNRTVAVSGTAVNSVWVTDPDDVTLTIIDDDIPAGCESGDIWCGTVRYADRFPSDAAGRKPLHWYHRDHDDQDMLEFVHNDFRYKVYTSSLGANPGGGTYVMPPFHIPERSKSLFSLGNLSATDPMGYWEMPNQDYLDWTLYISTNQDGATLEAKLPFNEAKFCCGHKWRWHGLDLYELNYAWAVGKEYKLRIVEDPRADRTPEVLGPPLYLEALGVQPRECAPALGPPPGEERRRPAGCPLQGPMEDSRRHVGYAGRFGAGLRTASRRGSAGLDYQGADTGWRLRCARHRSQRSGRQCAFQCAPCPYRRTPPPPFAEPGRQQPGHRRARHHRVTAGRRDADRDHGKYRGRGRSDGSGLRLPVGPLRHQHRGSDKLHLHHDRRRRGQGHPGEGHLQRRCRQRGVADQLRTAVRPAPRPAGRRRSRRGGEFRERRLLRDRGRHGGGDGDPGRGPRTVRHGPADGDGPGRGQPCGLLGGALQCDLRFR